MFVCADDDSDGYGVGDLTGCSDTINIDCDDGNSDINPNAVEICNSLDDNCNSLTDEGLTFDVDSDGYSSLISCAGSKDDCNDNDVAINPLAVEICDNMDNDCDSDTDEGGVCIDTSPPVITNFQPADGSTINSNSTLLSFMTDENAVCKYETGHSILWNQQGGGGGGSGGGSVLKNMSTTGGTSHSQLITELKTTVNNEAQSESYSVNANCVDSSGNSASKRAVFYVNITG